MKVIVILHGEDVLIDAQPDDNLAALRMRALVAYGQASSRPVVEWEIRDARGVYLDPAALVRDTPTIRPPGQFDGRLFLTLRVGVGA